MIIASPLTSSEVTVSSAVTLFGRSPWRVQNGSRTQPLEPLWDGSRQPPDLSMPLREPEFRHTLAPSQPNHSLRIQCDNVFFRMARQSTHQTKPNPEKSPRRDPTAAGQRDAAVNRIASHNYFLLEKFETGIVLTGTEVKSIRAGHANLKDSYGLVKDGELWLLNAHIGPYDHGNIFNHAPLRTRKLLVHKDEVRKLIGKTQQRGLTLIPTRMYFKSGKVKVELALAKGKQLWDKRETERRRTADKEAREAIARGRK